MAVLFIVFVVHRIVFTLVEVGIIGMLHVGGTPR